MGFLWIRYLKGLHIFDKLFYIWSFSFNIELYDLSEHKKIISQYKSIQLKTMKK
jgi:hypothetical protein